MKIIYTLMLGALLGLSAFAQTVDVGGPFSWRPKVVTPKFIDTRAMPGYDQAAIDAEDIINDAAKVGPWRFGYKYETDFSLDNSGTWTNLENGDRLWQLELVCDGAMTVNLIFENLFIPDGAYIYLYDVAKSNRVGAYTNRNNNVEKILGTELVHGDHIVVEYFEPGSVSGQGTLTVANVIHGYRSLNAVQGDLLKAFESSGNCNVDVNCTLGDGWENEIRSVAMIVVSGSGICTGALINNTCDDGTPYFLTADHCVGGSTASWSFRFNWESPPGTEICQTTGTSVNPGPPYDQTANGATQLYTSGATDVALLQITNMTLTDAQNWNCFYAGWDNTDALTVTQATGIHHPSGDLKKICREDNSPLHTPWNGAACWHITNWEQGVTEPGSSGSPLFDQNHRIIGQLYGGSAACSGTNDNNLPDYYGRFGISWPNLDTWLAPASCGTAPTTNDGWDPNSCSGSIATSAIEENCFDDCDGSITANVTGGSGPYTYDIGTGAQASNVFNGLCQGNYDITVVDDLGCVSTINVDLLGPVEIIGSTSTTAETLGNDGAINLTASGGAGTLVFSWTGPAGFNASTEDISGLATGTYSVTITDDNGCSTTITNIFVGSSLGLNEINSLQFSVYPNPSNNIFNVDLGNYAGSETQLVLRDVTGRIIHVITSGEDAIIELDLGETAPGTYYLNIVSGGMQTTLTLVKTK